MAEVASQFGGLGTGDNSGWDQKATVPITGEVLNYAQPSFIFDGGALHPMNLPTGVPDPLRFTSARSRRLVDGAGPDRAGEYRCRPRRLALGHHVAVSAERVAARHDARSSVEPCQRAEPERRDGECQHSHARLAHDDSRCRQLFEPSWLPGCVAAAVNDIVGLRRAARFIAGKWRRNAGLSPSALHACRCCWANCACPPSPSCGRLSPIAPIARACRRAASLPNQGTSALKRCCP